MRRYLEPLAADGIDTLVLGCTHYPVLGEVLRAEAEAMCGGGTVVVDSAHATARELSTFLEERAMARPGEAPGSLRLLVTNLPDRFGEVASRLLGRDAGDLSVEQVDL